MVFADRTLAVKSCIVSNSDNLTFECVSSLENPLKDKIFLIFDVAPQSVAAQIGNLNHSSELTIYK